MGYFLGVDIGTTYTAAAVWRDGRCDVASLGNRAPTIPSVVFLRDDGTVLIGEAAARRAASEPASVAREFKRRVGDPTPVIVGGTPYSADALMARLLRAVVDLVVEAEGSAPDGVAVTHPANWGPYKLDLFHQATRLADLDDVVTVSEPEAAAIHYASQSRVEPGAVIAVYDLGGGTFDAAVLRKTDDGWDVLGAPEGIERLGGVDFDAAVHHHVASAIGPALDDLSPDDPAALAAAARLRQECVDAKEALSADSDVSIPVLLPKLQTEVRLTRAEYEQMVRPALADTITSLLRALRSAGVEPGDVTTVLLVGGSSRTPLVAELVSSALGRPVAVDAHPKYGVALGAAITAAVAGGKRSAGDHTSVTTPPVEVPPTPEVPPAPAVPSAAPVAAAGAVAGAAGLAAGAAAGSTDVGAGAAAGQSGPAASAPGAATQGIADGPRPASGPGAPTRQAPPVAEAPAPPTIPAPTVASVPSAAASPPRGSAPRQGTAPTRARTEATAAAPGAPGGERGRDPRSVMVPYSGDQRPPASPPTGRTTTGASAPASGGRKGTSRRPLLLAVGALAAVAIGVGAAVALSGGGDDPSGGPAAATGGGETPAASDTPATEAPTTTAAPAGPFVQIDSVELDGGQYRVSYQVVGYVPQLDGGPESLHVHFFPDTQPPETAGTNGPDTSDWDVTDESATFLTKYTPATVGDATAMCSAVANVDHSVHTPETRTGNCVALPT